MPHTIHIIAAARPNFMKIAPLYHVLNAMEWADPVILHTGQHYDINMSDAFFNDLQLPEPDIHLGIGGGSHAEQTGNVMIAYEKVLLEKEPEMVVVVGDVNSTIACALAAAKVTYRQTYENTGLQRPLIAHLEAGLRSYDRTMPEEINRIATDVLADILWTPSPDGDENLIKEGIDEKKIVRVGNIMIDSLEMMRSKIEQENVFSELGLPKAGYAAVTLHRPANVDNPELLLKLCEMLIRVSENTPLVFPVHPRTRNNLEKNNLYTTLENANNIYLLEPQNYVRFMNLVFNSKLVITDSGGIQEETTYLGIPCLTLRPNTERPITITQGTNQLCTVDDIETKLNLIFDDPKNYSQPDLWDGKTAQRVSESIKQYLCV